MAEFSLNSVHPSLIVKLVGLTFIGLTAFGWLLVVIGFGIATTITPELRGNLLSYPYWIVTFFGPITFIAAIVNLFADKLPHSVAIGRIAGATIAFLSTFFITGLGIILYHNGIAIVIRAAPEFALQENPPLVNLVFAGSLLATIFWTIVAIMAHFYDLWDEKEK